MRDVLADPARLREGDPAGMLAAFASSGRQLQQAYRAARGASVPFAGQVRSITFCAMGGSAAAGDMASAALVDRAGAPTLTLRGYRVPASHGPSDLVVCVSYSGNTEETVAAFGAARERGCSVIAVCGGGRLAELALDAGVPLVGLGSLVGGVLGALAGAGVLSAIEQDVEDAAATLDAAGRDLDPDVPPDRNEAKEVAAWVEDRIPLLWGSEGVSAAAAWRWKTAFNENAEIPAFASALPELDHHEILGWTEGRGRGFALLILREEGEHESVGPRLRATLEEIDGSGLEWREVWARGRSPLARGLSLSLIGDLASAYHAIGRGIDPSAMASLTRVKERLAEARR